MRACSSCLDERNLVHCVEQQHLRCLQDGIQQKWFVPTTLLYDAIESGNLNIVRHLICEVGLYSSKCILWCIELQQLQILQWLLAKGLTVSLDHLIDAFLYDFKEGISLLISHFTSSNPSEDWNTVYETSVINRCLSLLEYGYHHLAPHPFHLTSRQFERLFYKNWKEGVVFLIETKGYTYYTNDHWNNSNRNDFLIVLIKSIHADYVISDSRSNSTLRSKNRKFEEGHLFYYLIEKGYPIDPFTITCAIRKNYMEILQYMLSDTCKSNRSHWNYSSYESMFIRASIHEGHYFMFKWLTDRPYARLRSKYLASAISFERDDIITSLLNRGVQFCNQCYIELTRLVNQKQTKPSEYKLLLGNKRYYKMLCHHPFLSDSFLWCKEFITYQLSSNMKSQTRYRTKVKDVLSTHIPEDLIKYEMICYI